MRRTAGERPEALPPSAAIDLDETARPGSPGAGSANHPPRIGSVRFEPERPRSGDSLRAIVEVSDDDADPVWIEYAWRIGDRSIDGSAPRVLLRDVPRGETVELRVTARDGKSSSEPETRDVRVANSPPALARVNTHAPASLTAGQPVVLRPEATDADGDPLSFRYEWRVDGVRQGESGDRFDTSQLHRGNRVQARVFASDGEDESEAIEVGPLVVGNAPPRILSTPGQGVGGADIFYQVRAEDPDGHGALSFALENAPEGMEIDPITGALRWQPRPDQVGTHHPAVVVSDAQGGRSRQAIEITVGEPPAKAAPAASRR